MNLFLIVQTIKKNKKSLVKVVQRAQETKRKTCTMILVMNQISMPFSKNSSNIDLMKKSIKGSIGILQKAKKKR